MLISISGIMGSGKTTLLKNIPESWTRLDFIELHPGTFLDKQNEIFSSCDELFKKLDPKKSPREVFITDGGLLDWFVYVTFFFRENKIGKDEFLKYEEFFNKNIKKNDIIFYLNQPSLVHLDDSVKDDIVLREKLLKIYDELLSTIPTRIITLKKNLNESFRMMLVEVDNFKDSSYRKVNSLGFYPSESYVGEKFNYTDACMILGKRWIDHKLNLTTILVSQKAIYAAKLTDKEFLFKKGEEQFKHIVSKEQLIPYEYWTDISIFFKPSMLNVTHPHYRLLMERLKEKWVKNSDTLVFSPCSGSKPYSKNMMYQSILKGAKAGYFDYAIKSVIPVMLYPIDTSMMYPNCFYDWPHYESEKLVEFATTQCLQMLIDFLITFNYKKVIFINNGFEQRYAMIINGLRKTGLFEVYDTSEDAEWLDAMKKKYKGMWQARINSSRETRKAIFKYINGDDKLREIFKLT